MPKLSKNRTKVDQTVDGSRKYTVEEACALVKKAKFAKFDETVDLAVRLGVNPKHADQMVRGTVVLPNGLGKSKRVLVIASGDKLREAEAAGADFFGGDELVEKIQKENWFDYDVVIATPDAMRVVGKLGTLLGPRGLMPNPKVGTVSANPAEAVKNAKGGQVRYRTDKGGIIHCTIGKASFEDASLKDNLQALLLDLIKAKPSTAKGQYLQKISLSSTMGVGVTIDQSSLSIAK